MGKLDALRGGYAVVATGRGKVVTSVPIELSVDHARVLDLCAANSAHTTLGAVREATKWGEKRTQDAVHFLMENGIAWVDMQGSEATYWIMGMLH